MEMSVRTEQGMTVVALAGELNARTSPDVLARVLELAHPDCKVILDLTAVTFLTSAGARMLLQVSRTVGGRGGRAVLAATRSRPGSPHSTPERPGIVMDRSDGHAGQPLATERIDRRRTHHYAGYDLCPGTAVPFGATLVRGGVNFSVYSGHATGCTLVLFRQGEREPFVEIPFPDAFRIGNVFAMTVFDLDFEEIEYGYRMTGPFDPEHGHRFDPSKVLLDPYAKAVAGRDVWGTPPDWDRPCPYRGRLVLEDFDWEGDRPLETPIEDLVIYEMHVRGFTRHPSAGVEFPGTFYGVREKIPYLKELGATARSGSSRPRPATRPAAGSPCRSMS
jgi:anti-anti-sigma factor